MSLNEKQLDALEKQHKEMLEAYAKKIKALQIVEAKLTEDIKNLNQVIDDHVKAKQDELNTRISETEKLKLEAITMKKEAQNLLYEAQAKTEDANKIYNDIFEAAQAHDEKIKTHVDTVSNANITIDKRHGECIVREEKSHNLIVEANKRIETALLSEQKAQDKVNELIIIDDAIKADIEVQKDLYFKNKQAIDEIAVKKSEIDSIKEKSDADMADAIKIRDSLDAAQARIERNSQELIKRHEECVAKEIQNKVIDQALKDRKAFLDGQEGRLNELKNNVMTLLANLEKQQATIRTVESEKLLDITPKEGESL